MTLADIQRRLAELGFDPGPADGISGPRTKAAIRAAQRWHGLKPDGIVGPPLTMRLIALRHDFLKMRIVHGGVAG